MNTVYSVCVIYIFAVCLSNAQSMPDFKQMKQDFDECREKTGASLDDAGKLIRVVTLDTKESQCFAACMDKKKGIIGADHKINVSEAKKMVEMIKNFKPDLYQTMLDIVTECQTKANGETDDCVIAMKFHNCIADKRKAANIPDFPNPMRLNQ